jgi:DnaJ like chaperone protein
VCDERLSQRAQDASRQLIDLDDYMIWQGKAFGALVGVLAGGPVGALCGAFIGHLFDAHAETKPQAPSAAYTSSVGVQEAFFRATFQVMGHIAKADGRVSEDDIRAARAMMTELRLGEREIQTAIELFNAGKAREFPLDQTLAELYGQCRRRPDLCRMFMQIQLQAALWSGSIDPAARHVLARACAALDVSAFELVQMEALLRMQRSSRQPDVAQPAVSRLTQAYQVLGVSHTASDNEVTKAYRRLMNQNHPDKLVAKGLPESMMRMAEEKTRQIRAAYELVRDARGMK